MKRIASSVSIVLVLLFVGAYVGAGDNVPIAERGYANPGSLVSAEELDSVKDRDDVKVIDFRNIPAFVTGHIPGAIQIGRSALENGDADVGLIAAGRAETAAVLADKGIRPTDTIVVYFDN